MSHSDAPRTSDLFVEYYQKQSISTATLERFGRVLELMLRVRDRFGLTTEALDVADIGCNAGTQAFLWAERGHRVHGIDINAALLAIARQRGRDQHLDVDFREGSATALPWPDDSLDVCLMPELLEHVADWQACLAEAARVLRPGGVLFLSTTNKLCPRQMEFELPLYSWYPAVLKRHYERLAVTSRPEIVNHAVFPAVNWFTPYQLRGELERLGFDAWDNFDWIDTKQRSRSIGVAVRLIRLLPPVRWLAHVATPYSMIIGAKRAPGSARERPGL